MKKEQWKQTAKKIADVLWQDRKLTMLLLGAAALLLVLLLTGTEKPPKEPSPAEPSDPAVQSVEDELCALLGAMQGVGKVQVMLRFASSGETVYAADTDDTADSRDGSESKKEKNSVVIVKNGQTESGLVVREDLPAVTGAAVVCEGGDDPIVRARIVETLSALFNIKSNHISVMPM